MRLEDLLELVAEPLFGVGSVTLDEGDDGCRVVAGEKSILTLPPPLPDPLKLGLQRLVSQGTVEIRGRRCFVSRRSGEPIRLGLRPPPAIPSVATNPQLEAAIAGAPKDRDRYLVYADYLQERGDPRGELIALQDRGATDARARRSAELLLEEKRDYFLGPIAGHPRVDLSWRLGFLERACLSLDGTERPAAAELVAALLGHPSAKFLQRLEVKMSLDLFLGGATLEAFTHGTIATLIVRSESTRARLGDVGPLGQSLSGLRALELRASFAGVSPLTVFPELRMLLIAAPAITARNVSDFASAVLPALETLKLRVDRNIPEQPILDLVLSPTCPALRHVAIKDARNPRDLEATIRRRRPLEQLSVT